MLLIIILILFIFLFLFQFEKTIPKIIHQTAPADMSTWHEIWPKCQESWRRNFPDWEYKMWTDQDLDEFMKTKYPEYYPMYIGYDANIKRIDAARYFILLEYGGIYADMDFECVKNFENLLPPDKVSIAESAFEGEVFQNALMVSPRSHPFWYSVIRELESYKHHPHPHHATGPQVLVRAYDENSVHSLPAAQFAVVTDPYYIAKKETLNRADQNVYAAHHGTCSWCQ